MDCGYLSGSKCNLNVTNLTCVPMEVALRAYYLNGVVHNFQGFSQLVLHNSTNEVDYGVASHRKHKCHPDNQSCSITSQLYDIFEDNVSLLI